MTYLLRFFTQCLTSRLARAYYSTFYLSLEARVGEVLHCPLGLFGPVVIGGGAVSTMYSSIVAFIVVLDFVHQVTFYYRPRRGALELAESARLASHGLAAHCTYIFVF